MSNHDSWCSSQISTNRCEVEWCNSGYKPLQENKIVKIIGNSIHSGKGL